MGQKLISHALKEFLERETLMLRCVLAVCMCNFCQPVFDPSLRESKIVATRGTFHDIWLIINSHYPPDPLASLAVPLLLTTITLSVVTE